MSQSSLYKAVISRLTCLASRVARILVWTVTSVSIAQDCHTIPIDDNDGLVKSPQNYALLYETDDVRVLEATIPPLSSQSMHSFTRPAILYVQSSVNSKTISPGLNDPIAHQKDKSFRPIIIRIGAPWLYATQNLSKNPFHAVRVELKHPGCRLIDASDSKKPPSMPEGEGVMLQSDVFRTVYEDGDVRVSEIDTPAQNLTSLQSSWPGFYYVVTTGHARTDGRMVAAFPIGSEIDGYSRSSAKSIHIVRFELKRALGK